MVSLSNHAISACSVVCILMRFGLTIPLARRTPHASRRTSHHAPRTSHHALQNVTRVPISTRRGAAADVGWPKNGDVRTPLKLSALTWFSALYACA
jgi:hypothetical protein